MQSREPAVQAVADAQRGNWVDQFAPPWLKPYARLARWDRPIGFWLLFWPCGFSLGLSAVRYPPAGFDWWALCLCLFGAMAMRGAGCTFNDIVDRDIDDKVERTRLRPIPSGQVSVRNAALFMILQTLVGLAILLQFNLFTVGIGIASLILVAIYPFMKRVTWWPQFFLGLAFSWGALVGYTSQTAMVSIAALVLYAGCILWTIGYDTIYALQDVEDDALVGVRSTARLFGRRARTMVGVFYVGAAILWCVAAAMVGSGLAFGLTLVLAIAILAWQVVTLNAKEPGNALLRFKANHWVGAAVTLAFLVEYWV
jgi:4-hydroxybenzoate polyprenyltransferase